MPRANAASRPRPRRSPRIAAAIGLSAALAACGGGGGGAPAPQATKLSAGPGCALTYVLTQSPLLVGDDPLLEQQWHLRNLGQSGGAIGEDLRAIDAWATTRGAGVRVAVVDDAIEVVHPDLQPNLVEGASFSYRASNRGSIWPLPCTADIDASGQPVDGHGTAVAGLVLARDGNAVGVAGVAPRASLVAFDALASGTDVDIGDALVRDAQANAIYQNSWGSPDDGALHPAPAAFVASIAGGIANGRGGKGSIFVFPAGNGGCYARNELQACMDDNSNYDGFVNRLGIVTVCAVDASGRRPYYGEPGANLLVCAPSSGDVPNVTTTTLQGGYWNGFSGTSASTPMVSGVVALMLSANPALTWRDVRLILAQTARHNDPLDADWLDAADGLRFHHRYGFGVADAQAAVAKATTWTSVGGSERLLTCTSPVRTPRAPLPDAQAGGTAVPVSDTLTVAGCPITKIEFVEAVVTIPHAYSGDLQIRLASPAGRVSELAQPRTCARIVDRDAVAISCGAYDGWAFGSVRHLGEAADGAWTLTVTDRVPKDAGTLERWSLRIHGR